MRRSTKPLPCWSPPGEGEDIVADYASLGFTLGRHPRRAAARAARSASACRPRPSCRALPHGRVARVTGLVTGRQRPGTASGVTFVTLEDETGMVNVIVWRDLAERQRKELLRSSLLTVYGTLEREGEVVHLIAGALARSDGAAGQPDRAVARFSLAARARGASLRARAALVRGRRSSR